MNAFITPIKLYDYAIGYGSQSKTKGKVTNALCSVDNIGSMVSLKSIAVGVSLSYQVEMWKAEYSGQTYCEIDGKEYQIKQATKTFNNLVVRLLLARG